MSAIDTNDIMSTKVKIKNKQLDDTDAHEISFKLTPDHKFELTIVPPIVHIQTLMYEFPTIIKTIIATL